MSGFTPRVPVDGGVGFVAAYSVSRLSRSRALSISSLHRTRAFLADSLSKPILVKKMRYSSEAAEGAAGNEDGGWGEDTNEDDDERGCCCPTATGSGEGRVALASSFLFAALLATSHSPCL